MNASRRKAGMDEATMSGLRERVYPGNSPYEARFIYSAGLQAGIGDWKRLSALPRQNLLSKRSWKYE